MAASTATARANASIATVGGPYRTTATAPNPAIVLRGDDCVVDKAGQAAYINAYEDLQNAMDDLLRCRKKYSPEYCVKVTITRAVTEVVAMGPGINETSQD